ncbi:hypothetical protein N0V94_006397 [Neodidymelliopsis sp. IMI 364377]|nr:hypothetical protein N0V94_006397 [Neodidymelliopsis sp. IMI 364377]
MRSISALSALFTLSLSAPLAVPQPTNILLGYPITLHKTVQPPSTGYPATIEHVENSEIVHLENLTIPSFHIDSAKLNEGSNLTVDLQIFETEITFPVTLCLTNFQANITNHSTTVTIRPITLPIIDIKFNSFFDTLALDDGAEVGDVKIYLPSPLARRQVNFWDEVIDIGIEVGTIVMGTNRYVNGTVARRGISFFGGVVKLDGVAVEVSIGDHKVVVDIGD